MKLLLKDVTVKKDLVKREYVEGKFFYWEVVKKEINFPWECPF